MLPETHGPVLWSPRLYVERDKNGVLDMFGAFIVPGLACHGNALSLQGTGIRNVLGEVWTDAIKRALLRFKSEMALGVMPCGMANIA
jgi:NAD-dependent oxidoreductase involved in siderophore biosynthesis